MAGMIWGAWLGDAAGALLTDERQTAVDIDAALAFTEGGQISEVGELMMCLWKALTISETPEEMIHKAASMYEAWSESHPMIMMSVCSPLVRCPPLAIAAVRWNLSKSRLDQFISSDVKQTHPHEPVQSCIIAYVRALIHLIQMPHDFSGSLRSVAAWMAHYRPESLLHTWWNEGTSKATGPCRELLDVWTLALTHLRQNTDWERGMFEALQTSQTNKSCRGIVVGGVLGALHGFRQLPRVGIDQVQQKHDRCPEWLQPRFWFDPYRLPPHKK